MMEPRTRAGQAMFESMKLHLSPPCTHNGDTWFDRSFCPEPCGSMHDRCVECGCAPGCYFESEEHADDVNGSLCASIIAIEDEARSS
jgi:hypothetical protein